MTKVPKRNEPGGLVLRANRLFVQKYDCVGNRLSSSVPFGLKNRKRACAGNAGFADQVIFLQPATLLEQGGGTLPCRSLGQYIYT